MINFEILVQGLVSFMLLKNICELDDVSPRKKDGVWYQVCCHILGQYSFNEAQYIRATWKNNSKSIRNIVIEKIFQNKNTQLKTTDSVFEIEILKEEWISLNKYINGSDRKRFGVGFVNFLSQKLQNLGTSCWLILKYNWFGIKESNKFWHGSFKR